VPEPTPRPTHGVSESELLATLAEELSAHPQERQRTADCIVQHAVELVAQAHHASLTIHSHRVGVTTLATTSGTARALVEAQCALDDGPCVADSMDGEWFRSGDLGSDARWPRWGPVAHDRGIHSVLSIRIMGEGEPHGALTLYSEAHRAFVDRHDVDLAMLYAMHAANALVAARLVGDLQAALGTRHVIGMAQGMLMERYQVGPDQAFGMLVRLSSTSNRKIRDLAVELTRGRDAPRP
jgi:hypothetical protein